MKQNYTYREIAHSWGLTSDEDVFFLSRAFFNWATANKVNIDYIFDTGIPKAIATSVSLEPEDLSKIEEYAFSTSLASRQRKFTITQFLNKTGIASTGSKLDIVDYIPAGVTAQFVGEVDNVYVFISTNDLQKVKSVNEAKTKEAAVKTAEELKAMKEFTIEDLKFRRSSFNESAWNSNLHGWISELKLCGVLSRKVHNKSFITTPEQFTKLADHIYNSGLMIPAYSSLVHWITGDSSEAMQLYFETRRKEIYGDYIPFRETENNPLGMLPSEVLQKLRASWHPNNGFNQFIRKHLVSGHTVLTALGLIHKLERSIVGFDIERLFQGAGVKFVCKGRAIWVSQCDIERIKRRLTKSGEHLKPQSLGFAEQHSGETVELTEQFEKVEKLLDQQTANQVNEVLKTSLSKVEKLLEQELKDNRHLTKQVNELRAELVKDVSEQNRVEQEYDRLYKKYSDLSTGKLSISLVPEKSEDVKALAEELEQTKKDLAISQKAERDFQSKCDIGDTKNKKLAEELTKANNKLKRISEYLK